VDIHALRATAATRLRHGVSAPIAAEILGHRDVKTPLRHDSDLRVEDMRAALDGLPAPPVPKKDAPLRAVVEGANPGDPRVTESERAGRSRRQTRLAWPDRVSKTARRRWCRQGFLTATTPMGSSGFRMRSLAAAR
jgi:hypothetical protein